jgi:replicative DNA helicase
VIETRPDIERRVLAEVISNPAALALADQLELGDLTDARHHRVLEAVRELQGAGCPIDICDLADCIALRDLSLGTHASESASLPYLTDLVSEAERYDGLLGVFEADLRQLRLIANERRL